MSKENLEALKIIEQGIADSCEKLAENCVKQAARSKGIKLSPDEFRAHVAKCKEEFWPTWKSEEEREAFLEEFDKERSS